MHKQLTNPEVAIKIELIPSIEQDKRTGLFVARFEQFPRASAAGKTPQEATDELLIIFGVMLKEKEENMKKQTMTTIMIISLLTLVGTAYAAITINQDLIS